MGSNKRSGCGIPRLLERLRSSAADAARPPRTRNCRRKGLGSKQYAHDTVGTGFPVLTSLFLVIPDYAKMRWFVRAPTGAQLKVWCKRVVSCFESVPFHQSWSPHTHSRRAAALATGCKFTITYGEFMYDLLQNPVLGEFLRSRSIAAGTQISCVI